MLLENLFPDAPRLPEHTAKRIVDYGEKRLKKYSVNSLQIYQHPTNNVTSSCTSATSHTSLSPTPLVVPETIRPERLQVGRLLGQGSFSFAYEITSFGAGDETSADDDEEEEQSSSSKSNNNSSSITRQQDEGCQHTRPLVIKVLQPKLIEKPALFAGCAADLVREGILLSKLNHVNVLRCHALGGHSIQAFGSGRHDAFFLVLERLDSTLKEKLEEWRQQAQSLDPSTITDTTSTQRNKSKNKNTKKKSIADHVLFLLSGGKHRRMQHSLMARTDLICELAQAIRYLHSNRIMHRDLKPDNLGVVLHPDTGTLTLKVFDLDVCRILPPESLISDFQTFQFTRHVGSPRYMAPEIARGEEYNAKADVYSFGLLAYEILSLKKPFSDIPSKMLDTRVFHEGVRPPCPVSWPRPVVALLNRCWSEKIVLRPTMNQVSMELRDTLDRMCPPAQVKQRRRLLEQREESSSSSSLVNKRRLRLRSLEESRTHRSESTIEVSQLSQEYCCY